MARRILLMLLWSGATAYSQTFEEGKVTTAHAASSWSRFAVLLSSQSSPISLLMDTQLRIGKQQVLQGRAHLNYHLSPQTSFSVGSIVFTRQENTTTTIALAQVLHAFAQQGTVPTVRLRLDYRWQTHHDLPELSYQNWRLRLQPAVSLPITPHLRFILNTEVFFEYSTPLLIDENRFQVGVQWQPFDTATLLTAYQNRAFFGEKLQVEHSLFVVLLVRLQV